MRTDIAKSGKFLAVMAVMAFLTAASCTQDSGSGAGGGGGAPSGGNNEEKFAGALSSLNADWKLYEIGENRGEPTIKVEVTEIVSFQDGKKAVEAIQKIDPKFKGYIDFIDSKTGTVVRKLEIIPTPGA